MVQYDFEKHRDLVEQTKFGRMNWLDALVYSGIDCLKVGGVLFFLWVFIDAFGHELLLKLPSVCSLLK